MDADSPVSRRQVLKGLGLVAACWALPGCPQRDVQTAGGELPAAAEASLAAAARYLWSRQREDGTFGSDRYGFLRRGQSLTPFVLGCLLRVPERLDPPNVQRARRLSRAFAALLVLRNEEGAIGFAESVADYPCYATALYLCSLRLARPAEWDAHARPSVDWLLSQQFRVANGWDGHAALGGWGMGTRIAPRPPHAGHVDLSMTRRVLEGLRAAGLSADAEAFQHTGDFVARCRAQNGAFVYSPVDPALNKGERAAPSRASQGYGSATCDGLLALDALGLTNSALFDDALDWLRRHHRIDENPGVGEGPMAPFAVAMRGYYRAGAARCFARFGGPADWQSEMIEGIVAEQQADGAFRNESPLQKEDDPLIATPFAVEALCDALGLV